MTERELKSQRKLTEDTYISSTLASYRIFIVRILEKTECVVTTARHYIIILTLCVLNFSEGTKTYIYILSLFHMDMTQVVEILPQVRQGPTYPT